ncbi:MAG: acyl-CoA dehydrogenase family protein [Candidatus Bathyarchaeia archaeon]
MRKGYSNGKNLAVKTALEVIDEAIQIYGGYGYVDSDLERYYRDVRLYRIGAGTEEILKIGIANEFYQDIGFKMCERVNTLKSVLLILLIKKIIGG